MTRLQRYSAVLVCALLAVYGPVRADPDTGPAPVAPPVQAPAPSAESTPVVAPAADGIAAGRALYAHHCSHCHGFNMVNPGNVSFDLREFPHNNKPRFVDSVTNGKNGRMPPWGSVLKPEEIDEIWAYVLTGGKS